MEPSEAFREAPIGLVTVASNGNIRGINPRAESLLAIENGVGYSLSDQFPASINDTIPDLIVDPPAEPTTVEEYYPVIDRWLEITVVSTANSFRLYVADTSEAHEYRQERERIERELRRQELSTKVMADMLSALVEAADRATIADVICSALGETGLYSFAWVGEQLVGTDDVVIRAVSGDTGETLSAIEGSLANSRHIPEIDTITDGQLTTVTSLPTNEELPEVLRRAAFADGIQSLIAIPLRFGDRTYGVVGLYANRPTPVSSLEQESLRTIGELAGFAITAMREQQLATADAVTELQLIISGSQAPLAALTADEGYGISIGSVVRTGNIAHAYLDIMNEPDIAVIREQQGVQSARVISETAEGTRMEVELYEGTPIGTILTQGASIVEGTYHGGEGSLRIHVPPEESVREIIEPLGDRLSITVEAKRTTRLEGRPSADVADTLDALLTDRQETVLRTAFYADYFESPRGSTAEEVANSLGITGSTLLYHLRAGEKKLLTAYFSSTSADEA